MIISQLYIKSLLFDIISKDLRCIVRLILFYYTSTYQDNKIEKWIINNHRKCKKNMRMWRHDEAWIITHESLIIALYFLGKDFSLFGIRILKNHLCCYMYIKLCCLNIYNIKSTLSDIACNLISQIVALEFVKKDL